MREVPRLWLDDGLLLMARPLLRYPGGKARLAPRIVEIARQCVAVRGAKTGRRATRFIEPFVGGGSVFFAMHEAGLALASIIADKNHDLINLYEHVAREPDQIVKVFDSWSPQTGALYYHIRDVAVGGMTPIELATRDLWLNRLCFNGLYRKNRRGEFNASWGHFKRHRALDVENLHAVSELLRSATILHADFREVIRMAGAGDIIYVDPPYAVGGKRAFVEYTGRFEWSDHVDLVAELVAAVERGAIVIASNSWLDETVELYTDNGFNIERVEMARSINCKGGGRKKVPELLAWRTR